MYSFWCSSSAERQKNSLSPAMTEVWCLILKLLLLLNCHCTAIVESGECQHEKNRQFIALIIWQLIFFITFNREITWIKKANTFQYRFSWIPKLIHKQIDYLFEPRLKIDFRDKLPSRANQQLIGPPSVWPLFLVLCFCFTHEERTLIWFHLNCFQWGVTNWNHLFSLVAIFSASCFKNNFTIFFWIFSTKWHDNSKKVLNYLWPLYHFYYFYISTVMMTFLKSLFMWKNPIYNFLKANNNMFNIFQDFTIANKKTFFVYFWRCIFFSLEWWNHAMIYGNE